MSIKEKLERLSLEKQGIRIVDKDLYNREKIKNTVLFFMVLVIYMLIGYFIGYFRGLSFGMGLIV